MEPEHCIVVENVKNEESMCHSVALIEGHVKCKCRYSCRHASEIVSCNNGKNHHKWKLVLGRFKLLVQLSLGWNEIHLEWTKSQTVVRLEYQPRDTSYCVKLLYMVFKNDGSEGRFQCPPEEDDSILSACRRIILGAQLAQTIYAETLYKNGFGRRTFQLQLDETNATPICHCFRSEMSVDDVYSKDPEELWLSVAHELAQSDLWSEKCKYIAFVSCTRYSNPGKVKPRTYVEMLENIKGHCALGGNGLALMGTGCLYCWPSTLEEVTRRLKDCRLVDWENFMDDSAFRGTRGGCFATTLGAVVHELGHTFDLGHTSQGIMGRGFNNVDTFFMPTVGKTNQNESARNDIMNCGLHERHFHPKEATKSIPDSCHDGLFWTKSCAALLSSHRWFNDASSDPSTEVPTYKRCTLHSSRPWRVIEARDASGTVLESWIFSPGEEVHAFTLTRSKLWLLPSTEKILVVAQDKAGNILKCEVDRSNLPQLYTRVKFRNC